MQRGTHKAQTLSVKMSGRSVKRTKVAGNDFKRSCGNVRFSIRRARQASKVRNQGVLLFSGSPVVSLLRPQAASRAKTPINAKTPTEFSLDRIQSGPEQGSTPVRVTNAKIPAFRMDAIPPIQSGTRERPTATNNHSADETIAVPPTRKTTPKTTKSDDSAAHSRRTIQPAMTIPSPYSNGTPTQARPILRFGILATLRHCTASWG